MAKLSPKDIDADIVTELLNRIERILVRCEGYFPVARQEPDWKHTVAARWRRDKNTGYFRPILRPQTVNLRDLKHIDAQSEAVDLNTLQFISGYAANNTLLTGARGTGKSSLIKGLLNKYASRGLRLIEVDKADLFDLPEIVDRIYALPNKFILFCDDLLFGEAEHGYTSLKAVFDGSASAAAENVLVYATSNRRHLMPEVLRENMELQRIDDEIHPGETVEEKLSLSERFGLWVSFHPFNREQYLAIVDHWLKSHRVVIANKSPAHQSALQWAATRGSYSGRIAYQFARDLAGRKLSQTKK